MGARDIERRAAGRSRAHPQGAAEPAHIGEQRGACELWPSRVSGLSRFAGGPHPRAHPVDSSNLQSARAVAAPRLGAQPDCGRTPPASPPRRIVEHRDLTGEPHPATCPLVEPSNRRTTTASPRSAYSLAHDVVVERRAHRRAVCLLDFEQLDLRTAVRDPPHHNAPPRPRRHAIASVRRRRTLPCRERATTTTTTTDEHQR